ncbi:hypothetical protein [Pimelobacter sp. 30-1]|uniref:hypothetical protein n=1 Tax=Pimelobacter sp. 30-1 TaxID=2004991 RepID=UPI001C047BC9|nr:hypothetical protein [Pimelobacter sp. 30-1]MBU2694044.1 hypothetical protein [Pimelobacter sp. 30-1]
MNALEFTAAAIDSLAWPLAVVLLVLVLRKHAPEFLASIRKVKVPGIEVELEKAKSEVAELVVSVGPGTADASDVLVSGSLHPRAVIDSYYEKLEQALRSLLRDPRDAEGRTFVEVLRKAQDGGVLTAEGAGAAHALRLMRNAAMQQDEWTLTSGDAAEFAILVDAAIKAIEDGGDGT